MDLTRHALLIHGSGAGAWEWLRWRVVFEGAGWTTQALDLQPGRSGLALTTFEDYAAQVTAALADSGPGTVLVGASLGGTLALAAGGRAPAAAMVLVNAVPPGGTPGWPRQPTRFPSVVAWSGKTVAETLSSLPDADPAVLEEAVPERWRDESGAVMRALWAGVQIRPPGLPTLAVLGDLDDQVPPGVGLTLARRLRADALRLRGVSHLGALLGSRAAIAARLSLAWLDTALEDVQQPPEDRVS